MISRRKFLQLGTGALAGLTAASAFAFESTTDQVEFVHKQVMLSRLPREFENYKIGFLTDVHLSPALPEEWIIHCLELLKEQEIDLLALGGDYLWIPQTSTSKIYGRERNPKYSYAGGLEMAGPIYEDFAACVASFIPRDGAYAVLGNHDRWYSPNLCKNALLTNKIELLLNTSAIIQRGESRLVLFGVDDYWTGFPSLHPLPPRQKHELRIVLSHNPDFLSVVHRNNWDHFDLGLCGHTHGGQIRLPGLGAPFYNITDTRLKEGLVNLEDKWVYTSRGLGMVELPYRINCRPEVTLLELRQA